jgi:hypothetical protein
VAVLGPEPVLQQTWDHDFRPAVGRRGCTPHAGAFDPTRPKLLQTHLLLGNQSHLCSMGPGHLLWRHDLSHRTESTMACRTTLGCKTWKRKDLEQCVTMNSGLCISYERFLQTTVFWCPPIEKTKRFIHFWLLQESCQVRGKESGPRWQPGSPWDHFRRLLSFAKTSARPLAASGEPAGCV